MPYKINDNKKEEAIRVNKEINRIRKNGELETFGELNYVGFSDLVKSVFRHADHTR